MVHESMIEATDPEILEVLGRRLRALRDARDLTMEEVAGRAGLSAKTVSRAEAGQNPTLLTVLRLLRVYDRLGTLEQFIPEAEVSPMALIRQKRAGGRRG